MLRRKPAFITVWRCAALASEGRTPLVALVRRDDESVADLLTRLEAALARVADEDVTIDEVSAYIKPHRKPPLQD